MRATQNADLFVIAKDHELARVLDRVVAAPLKFTQEGRAVDDPLYIAHLAPDPPTFSRAARGLNSCTSQTSGGTKG
ncbi:hypothetical protein U879_06445 [Defluviimonas sp. 20V17]|nr:hypothetical protein U879_06445 [Defluviimonas sp. 20V17]